MRLERVLKLAELLTGGETKGAMECCGEAVRK